MLNFFMGLFGKKKVIDLTERYKKQKEQLSSENETSAVNSSSENGFDFFRNLNASQISQNAEINPQETEEKKKKLAKRLMEITNRLEESSKQIYQLQQRIELLERKLNVGSY